MRFLTQKKDEGFSDTNVWIVSKVTLITIPSLTAHPLVPLLSPIFYVTSWNNEEEIDTLPWRVEPCFLSTRMCAFHELSVTLYLLLKIKRHSHIIMHFSFVKYHQVSKCKALQLSWDEGIESSPAGEGLGCTLGWEMDPEPRTHTHSPESQPCPGLPAEKWPACQGKWSWPSSLVLWHPTWMTTSSSGVLSRAKCCWGGFSVGPWTRAVAGTALCEGWESWVFAACRRESSGEIIAAFQYFKGPSKKDREKRAKQVLN